MNPQRNFSAWPLLCAGLLILNSCASIPKEKRTDSKYLFQQACKPGRVTPPIKEAKGSVWMKAKSTEASGQFPAHVFAKAPGKLNLEITNLIGGTEAIIEVDGKAYSITRGDSKKIEERGYGSWGGIPLTWATDLFLGKIPCPTQPASKLRLKAKTDELEVEALEGKKVVERFVYQFKPIEGELWPQKLHWERKGQEEVAVDFEFDSPEETTLSPLRWEAKSTRGEVKMKWRQRDLSYQ
ncbi:hypothetical protein K2X30_07550 [bacterium]|nr:hypothetical protein [bacterium]